MKHNVYLLIAAIVSVCLFSACASGPEYSSVKSSLKPQQGKGLALIYFKRGMGGAAAKIQIYANGQLLTEDYRRGGFYAHQAPSGPLRLSVSVGGRSNEASDAFAGMAGWMGSAQGTSNLAQGADVGVEVGKSLRESERQRNVNYTILDVKPGNVYYVEMVVTGFRQLLMKVRTKEEALEGGEGIQNCRWLNPDGKGRAQ